MNPRKYLLNVIMLYLIAIAFNASTKGVLYNSSSSIENRIGIMSSALSTFDVPLSEIQLSGTKST